MTMRRRTRTWHLDASSSPAAVVIGSATTRVAVVEPCAKVLALGHTDLVDRTAAGVTPGWSVHQPGHVADPADLAEVGRGGRRRPRRGWGAGGAWGRCGRGGGRGGRVPV